MEDDEEVLDGLALAQDDASRREADDRGQAGEAVYGLQVPVLAEGDPAQEGHLQEHVGQRGLRDLADHELLGRRAVHREQRDRGQRAQQVVGELGVGEVVQPNDVALVSTWTCSDLPEGSSRRRATLPLRSGRPAWGGSRIPERAPGAVAADRHRAGELEALGRLKRAQERRGGHRLHPARLVQDQVLGAEPARAPQADGVAPRLGPLRTEW